MFKLVKKINIYIRIVARNVDDLMSARFVEDEVTKLEKTTEEQEDWDMLVSDKTINDVNEDILKEYIKRKK